MSEKPSMRTRFIWETSASLLAFVALATLFSSIDLFEWLYEFSRAHEDYELDDVFAAFMALPAILLIIVVRRLVDLKREMALRVNAQETARHLASVDPLTGLANRFQFFIDIKQTLSFGLRKKACYALFHIDLDRFKQINDRYGPVVGDGVLKQVANLIEDRLDDQDLLARVSSDEFLLLKPYKRRSDVTDLGQYLVSLLDRSFQYQGVEHSVTASIGIAINDDFTPQNYLNSERLMTSADIAMFTAKSNGRNRCEVYHPAMRQKFEEQTILGDDLIRACEQKEFEAFFQPLVDAQTFDVVGAEALVRWRHPTRGLLAPAEFLDTAETLGLISQIDQAMLEEAIKIRHKIEASGLVAPRISVNISADRLKSPLFLHMVRNINVDPASLIFEISEAVTFDTLDDMSRYNLEALAEQGFEVEIDDFGSGRASILSLLEMEPKRLKIDRNLIAPIIVSEGSRKLVKSVVDMATALGVEVVAEGVETLEHANILAAQGCRLLQGYYFATPMPSDHFIQFLHEKSGSKQATSELSA
jgi:diguanylate cyclase (GGDEF)-like protein